VQTGGGRRHGIPTDEIIINQAIISGIAESAKLGREIEVTIPEI